MRAQLLWGENNLVRKAREEAWWSWTPTRQRRRVRPRLELEEGDASDEWARRVSRQAREESAGTAVRAIDWLLDRAGKQGERLGLLGHEEKVGAQRLCWPC